MNAHSRRSSPRLRAYAHVVQARLPRWSGKPPMPHATHLLITWRCNLRCTGCYSGLYSKDGELSETEIDGILAECRRIGVYFVVVSGGEPYMMKDVWLRLFRK